MGARKWCARCGQRFQKMKPGAKCYMCGWTMPPKKPTLKKKQKSNGAQPA